MAKRKRYDFKTPGTRELIDEIVHGTFVKEGTLLAFPTCFPGSSAPIRADESRITALDATADGGVYGGTSGYATHLFVGMFHGVTGAVLDMGTVEGADQCATVCCGEKSFVAGVNGQEGGRLVGRGLQPLPFDLIQEWGFERRPFEELGKVGEGERIVHMAADPERKSAVGISENHLFGVDLEEKSLEVVSSRRSWVMSWTSRIVPPVADWGVERTIRWRGVTSGISTSQDAATPSRTCAMRSWRAGSRAASSRVRPRVPPSRPSISRALELSRVMRS